MATTIANKFVRQHFPHRFISLRGDLQWLARSPDLTPCDFFLWGYLKSLVHVDRPRTIAHLKNNIRDVIANIPIDMLQRVDTDFKIRLNQCMRNGGRHLPDVIFKTAWNKNWDIVFSNKTKFKTITEVLLFLLTFQISKFLWRTLY